MPTIYTDQFYFLDPFSPPAGGTAITAVDIVMTDVDDTNSYTSASGDFVTIGGTDVDITAVYNGDIIRVNIGGSVVEIEGATLYLANGQQIFTPTDGTALEDGTFVSTVTFVSGNTNVTITEMGPPCFFPGTLILTKAGSVPIETLQVGDLIWTADHGFQPLKELVEFVVTGEGDMAPVRFEPGALGNIAALTVSPQHRMLISGWNAQIACAADEVLVPAKHLVNGTTIRRVPCKTAHYFHLIMSTHELIFAEGIASESFDPEGLFGLMYRARKANSREIAEPSDSTVRPVAKRNEARVMVDLGLSC